MVLVRIERSGVSVYDVVPLLEMAAFGCAPTESLKLVLNNVFQVDQVDLQITAGNVLLNDYEKLVCATSVVPVLICCLLWTICKNGC